MFCPVALAARVEAAEVRLMRRLGQAAVSLGHPGAFVEPFAGGVAISGGSGSAISKIAGAGFAAVPSSADFDTIERRYRDAGVPLVVEIATLADLACIRVAEACGYRLLRVETVLGRALERRDPASQPASSSAFAADIAVVDPDDHAAVAAWRQISVDGFGAVEAPEGRPTAAELHTRDAVDQASALFATLPDARRYLARRGGEPAAVASLRFDEDRIAQCCGATTLLAHRRHGLQTALLLRRLADAAAAGCDLAVVTTEPGSRSQANCQRHGFVPLYARLALGTPE